MGISIKEDGIKKYTAVQAGVLPLINGTVVYVISTDITFTSKGFWAIEEGAWVKK